METYAPAGTGQAWRTIAGRKRRNFELLARFCVVLTFLDDRTQVYKELDFVIEKWKFNCRLATLVLAAISLAQVAGSALVLLGQRMKPAVLLLGSVLAFRLAITNSTIELIEVLLSFCTQGALLMSILMAAMRREANVENSSSRAFVPYNLKFEGYVLLVVRVLLALTVFFNAIELPAFWRNQVILLVTLLMIGYGTASTASLLALASVFLEWNSDAAHRSDLVSSMLSHLWRILLIVDLAVLSRIGPGGESVDAKLSASTQSGPDVSREPSLRAVRREGHGRLR